MKKIVSISLFSFLIIILSSCVVLPDGMGGSYSYGIGGNEIEYTRPDGSKSRINQDGTITEKIR